LLPTTGGIADDAKAESAVDGEAAADELVEEKVVSRAS